MGHHWRAVHSRWNLSLEMACELQQALTPQLVPTCPGSAFYKGESQEKKLPGDWKEQRFLPGSPAHVVLEGSWGLLFSQSHVVVVSTPWVSESTSSTVVKIANHGSI